MADRSNSIIMVGRWRPDSANGVDKTIVNLSRELVRLGQQVVLWHASPKYSQIRKIIVEGAIEGFELPVSLRGLRLPPATQAFVAEQSKAYKIAHFHCAFTPSNNAIAALLNCPYTLTPNGPYSPAAFDLRTNLKKKVWLFISERAYLNRAAFIHALSEKEKTDIQGLCRQSRFIVAPNGISLDSVPDLSPARRSSSNDQPSKLLFLGRLAVHHKGLDRLLTAFARVPAKAKLILAGPDFRSGELVLKRFAQRLGIAGRVEFTGPVYGDQKWALIRDCDVFVHTSRWEGIPFAVLEAMAVGKPVVVSEGTNLAGYVAGSGAGWVAAPGHYADALRAAIGASPAELEQRGSRARALILEQFQWPQIASKIMSGYQTFCS